MRKIKDIFDYINLIILSAGLFLVIVPFYYVIVKSFITSQEWTLSGGMIWWPRKPTLENYIGIFDTGRMLSGFINSLFYTVVGVIYSMFLTVTLAYGLSKKDFPGRNLVQNVVVIAMFFDGGMVTFFLVVKSLGLIGSRWAEILPLGLNLFNTIIMRSFFESIPAEMEEAAVVDGAGPFTIFTRIHLPLVKHGMAILLLYYAVERWNEWFFQSLFIGDAKKWSIQLVLRQVLSQTVTFTRMITHTGKEPFSEGIKAAAVIVSIVPIMCVFPFVQKYFAKGVMVGAIKS